MIPHTLALFAGAAMLATGALAAPQTGTEMLFSPDSFTDVETGTTLTYSHVRSADAKIPVRSIDEGSITIALIDGEEGKTQTEVTMRQGKGRRVLDRLPSDRGNPVFVTFLESSVSSVSFATKGSPFYIRNRIKEAFGTGGSVSEGTAEIDGEEVTVTHIEYRPFKGDRNARQMGKAFENLAIQFTLSDEVPGHYVALKTEAKVDDIVYFIEEIRFEDSMQEAQ